MSLMDNRQKMTTFVTVFSKEDTTFCSTFPNEFAPQSGNEQETNSLRSGAIGAGFSIKLLGPCKACSGYGWGLRFFFRKTSIDNRKNSIKT